MESIYYVKFKVLVFKRKKVSSASISELIPIISYDDLLGAFITESGFMDIYGIRTTNVQALSEYEQDYLIAQHFRFLQNYDGEFKMVSVVFPVDLTEQRMFLVRKYEKTGNPYTKRIIEEKLRELEKLEDTNIERDYYYILFAQDRDEMRKNQVKLESLLGSDVRRLSREKKIDIIRQLYNQSSLAYRRDK